MDRPFWPSDLDKVAFEIIAEGGGSGRIRNRTLPPQRIISVADRPRRSSRADSVEIRRLHPAQIVVEILDNLSVCVGLTIQFTIVVITTALDLAVWKSDRQFAP